MDGRGWGWLGSPRDGVAWVLATVIIFNSVSIDSTRGLNRFCSTQLLVSSVRGGRVSDVWLICSICMIPT